MELELDQALSKGYRNIYGQTIMPNEEYLQKKGKIEGKDYLAIKDSGDAIDYTDSDSILFMRKKLTNKVAKNSKLMYNKNDIIYTKDFEDGELNKVLHELVEWKSNYSDGYGIHTIDGYGNHSYFYLKEGNSFKVIAKSKNYKTFSNIKQINEILKGYNDGIYGKSDKLASNIEMYRNRTTNNIRNNGILEGRQVSSSAIRQDSSNIRQPRRVERTNNYERIGNNNRINELKDSSENESSFSMQKNDKSEDVQRSIKNFEKAKGNIDRKDVINIAKYLNVYHKSDTYIDENMRKKSGNNKNPQIIEIDIFFKEYKDKEDLRKQAYKYAFDNYKNKAILIKDLKASIDIPQSGLKKTFGKNQDNIKMQTANNLPRLIEESVYLNSSKNSKNSNILFHYLYVPISISNENELAMITIREDLTDKISNSKFYYHDIRTVKNIEKDFVHAMPHKKVSNMLFEQNLSLIKKYIKENKFCQMYMYKHNNEIH